MFILLSPVLISLLVSSLFRELFFVILSMSKDAFYKILTSFRQTRLIYLRWLLNLSKLCAIQLECFSYFCEEVFEEPTS